MDAVIKHTQLRAVSVSLDGDPRRPFAQIPDYISREFINTPRFCGGARILCSIQNGDNYEILISDCGREIRLHGAIDSNEAFTNFVFKINTIIEELNKLKNFVGQNLK